MRVQSDKYHPFKHLHLNDDPHGQNILCFIKNKYCFYIKNVALNALSLLFNFQNTTG